MSDSKLFEIFNIGIQEKYLINKLNLNHHIIHFCENFFPKNKKYYIIIGCDYKPSRTLKSFKIL